MNGKSMMLLNKISQIIKQPYPLDLRINKQVPQILLASLFVFVFFIFFQPFGLKHEHSTFVFKVSLNYGLATLIVCSVNNLLLPILCKKCFNEKSWTFLKNILFGMWYWLTISLAMLIVNYLNFSQNEISLKSVFLMLLYVFILGFIVVIVVGYFYQQLLFNKHTSISNKINVSPSLDKKQIIDKELTLPLAFNSDLRIPTSKIFYLESMGNYIKVIWEDSSNIMKTTTVRYKIKDLEHKLSDIQYIFRSHRSFLLNINKIIKISGDSQGLKVKLNSITQLLPVSRNKIENFRNLMSDQN